MVGNASLFGVWFTLEEVPGTGFAFLSSASAPRGFWGWGRSSCGPIFPTLESAEATMSLELLELIGRATGVIKISRRPWEQRALERLTIWCEEAMDSGFQWVGNKQASINSAGR